MPPRPDISSADAFKATLLRRQRSIVMIDPATGTSGKHLAEVFGAPRHADQLKAKMTSLPAATLSSRSARARSSSACTQISEILPVKGVRLVGPLPAELQKVTIYQAAITARPPNLEAARHSWIQVRAPGVRAAFARKRVHEPMTTTATTARTLPERSDIVVLFAHAAYRLGECLARRNTGIDTSRRARRTKRAPISAAPTSSAPR
jgi:hypothetical protein